MSEKPKPIKRNPALVEFSKDHHFGLLLVWKIRQGQQKGIPAVRIGKYVNFFYQKDLMYHFADEETYLFTKLPENDLQRLRAEKEHAEVRALVSSIKHEPEAGHWLTELANLLEAHIRFEERELFNRLQNTMSEKELLKLLNGVPARPHLRDDEWEDQFWLRTETNAKDKNHAD